MRQSVVNGPDPSQFGTTLAAAEEMDRDRNPGASLTRSMSFSRKQSFDHGSFNFMHSYHADRKKWSALLENALSVLYAAHR